LAAQNEHKIKVHKIDTQRKTSKINDMSLPSQNIAATMCCKVISSSYIIKQMLSTQFLTLQMFNYICYFSTVQLISLLLPKVSWPLKNNSGYSATFTRYLAIYLTRFQTPNTTLYNVSRTHCHFINDPELNRSCMVTGAKCLYSYWLNALPVETKAIVEMVSSYS